MAIGKKVEEVRVNREIRAKEVRLISSDGKQLGIVPVPEALRIAGEEGFDLVEVAPSADPPVCKIMDYGKFKYEASKKVQDARKRSRTVQLKEIKVRPRTDDHDLAFKIKNLKKFLEKNNRVKVTLTFRGREMAYMNQGVQVLERIASEVTEEGTVDQPPTSEARNRMSMVIVPK
jgi:translation initiation factor IF-3